MRRLNACLQKCTRGKMEARLRNGPTRGVIEKVILVRYASPTAIYPALASRFFCFCNCCFFSSNVARSEAFLF